MINTLSNSQTLKENSLFTLTENKKKSENTTTENTTTENTTKDEVNIVGQETSLKNTDTKKVDLKKVGLSLAGGALGAALGYVTFSLALVPISFLIQLLISGGVAVQIPQNIIQLLQLGLSLGVVSSEGLSVISGAIAGGKTINEITKTDDPTTINNLKISFDKFKDSQSLVDYIRNGFNLGVEWGKETNAKAGNWANVPLALSVAAISMAPLALLVASLAAGVIPLVPALIVGLLASAPLGIKTFNTVKNFGREVYGLIGGAIGGAVGAAVGTLSKVFNGIKNLFSKKKAKTEDKDEFQKNSPYKNTGLENLLESGGKVTESFLKGASDTLSFTALINNIITKQPNGLGTVASIIGGTIKSLQGASILKQAAVNNEPQIYKVGLFRFLSGFSMLLSFLAPLFGPMGVIGFSVASLLFMGLEKFFETKNAITEKLNSKAENDQVSENNEVNSEDNKDEKVLKKSYAVGAASEDFINSLGSLGKFWMGWDTIFGGNYGGLTSIFGLVGSTRDILQGAKMMQMAKERNNLKVGAQGLLNVIGGVALALAALGLGRIFGITALGIEIAKLVINITSMISSKEDQKVQLAKA